MKHLPKDVLENLIIDEVMKEAMEKGPGNVSTKRVAETIKVSEPAIFAHFPTKATLMNATFVKAWNTMFIEPSFSYEEYNCMPEENFRKKIDEDLKRQLKQKKEVAFITNYVHSEYLDFRLYKITIAPLQAILKKFMHVAYPTVEDKDLDLITGIYIDFKIRCLYFLMFGIVADTEENRKILTLQLASSVKGALIAASKDN
jgi:hypothetical protein